MVQRTDREMRLAPLPKRYSEATPDGFGQPVLPLVPGHDIGGAGVNRAPMRDTVAATDGALLQAQIRAKLAIKREMFGEVAGGAIKQRRQRPPKRVREAIRREKLAAAARSAERDGVMGFAYERAPAVRLERAAQAADMGRKAWDAGAFRRDIAEQKATAIRKGRTYADKQAKLAQAGK